ncbi:MAG: NTP transferase domain-containing protein [Candidatus Omnitrophica bacterium]|nr:NTP transferase domain-containing protein [Candidatus Omnitrophota bacterium]
MLYAVIIAGGAGKRLWPASRKGNPKFLLKLDGKASLLKSTVSRAKELVPANNIFIVANKEHVRPISKELPRFPRKNIIAEPVSRNTAPAICVAAALIDKKDPNGLLFVMPADHIIKGSTSVKEIFNLAALVAHLKGAIVTIGIKPKAPLTGYGYIKQGKLYKRLMAKTKYDVFKVDRFTEKPSLPKAKQFLKTKKYLWNNGIFIATAKTFLEEFKRCKPSLYKITQKIQKGLLTKKQRSYIDRYYKKFQNISMDYAIMEKTKKAYVIKSDIAWYDIGSWASLDNYLCADSKGNIIKADHIGVDTNHSVVMGKKGHLIATCGLDGLVIIQTKDATIVCSKDRAEDVKSLVELIEKKGLKRYL